MISCTGNQKLSPYSGKYVGEDRPTGSPFVITMGELEEYVRKEGRV